MFDEANGIMSHNHNEIYTISEKKGKSDLNVGNVLPLQKRSTAGRIPLGTETVGEMRPENPMFGAIQLFNPLVLYLRVTFK
jgi:hypothetical protein